jgi:hypothetical protein
MWKGVVWKVRQAVVHSVYLDAFSHLTARGSLPEGPWIVHVLFGRGRPLSPTWLNAVRNNRSPPPAPNAILLLRLPSSLRSVLAPLLLFPCGPAARRLLWRVTVHHQR